MLTDLFERCQTLAPFEMCQTLKQFDTILTNIVSRFFLCVALLFWLHAHTRTRAHAHTRTRIRTHTDKHTRTHTDKHTQTNTHRQTHTDKHTQTHTHKQTHTLQRLLALDTTRSDTKLSSDTGTPMVLQHARILRTNHFDGHPRTRHLSSTSRKLSRATTRCRSGSEHRADSVGSTQERNTNPVRERHS